MTRAFPSCLLLCLLARSLAAHTGPPFPIIVDKLVGPVVISLWTHPDVGIGTFSVFVTAPPGAAIPDDLKFDIAVQPATARLAEARYPMQRASLRGQVQFDASVPFDAQEMWNVRIFVASQKGSGEAAASVEVTPPGLGRWDLLLFSAPFLGIGWLWFRMLMRRREFRQSQTPRE